MFDGATYKKNKEFCKIKEQINKTQQESDFYVKITISKNVLKIKNI
jgi:hypothetical protein